MAKGKTQNLSPPGQKIPLVALSLLSQTYLIQVERIREFVEMVEITPVPQTPSYLLGVIDLRGEVIPIVDPSHFLNENSENRSRDEDCLAICDMLGGPLGFPGSNPRGILWTTTSPSEEEYTPLVEVEGEVLPLFDLEALSTREERDEMEKIRRLTWEFKKDR